MEIKTFKELILWQKSMDLAVLVYRYTDEFPKEELYGLVTQMRRAAVSIPSCISEGWMRKNTKEFVNFLSMANGSSAELETQIIFSARLGYIDEKLRKDCLSVLNEVQRMIPSMMRSLGRTNR